MTLYELVLFVHVGAAVIWVGGAAMFQLMALPVLARGEPGELAAFAGTIERIGQRVLIPASLTAFLAGLALVWEGEFVQISDDWIVVGLVLFAITFLAGAGYFGPEAGRIQKMITAEGAAAAQGRIRRFLALTRIDLVLLFLIIFDMTVKPSFDDVGALLAALAAGVALALLFALPTLRGRPA